MDLKDHVEIPEYLENLEFLDHLDPKVSVENRDRKDHVDQPVNLVMMDLLDLRETEDNRYVLRHVNINYIIYHTLQTKKFLITKNSELDF